MEQQRKVQTIPATLKRFTATPIAERQKRKVAGYARVSTDHDDQSQDHHFKWWFENSPKRAEYIAA